MRKFYPAKCLLFLFLLVLMVNDLAAQRSARRRTATPFYSCGLTAGAVAKDQISTRSDELLPGSHFNIRSFSFDNLNCYWPLYNEEDMSEVQGRGAPGMISGIVKDREGNPIPFASVIIKGTNIGVSGDEDGNFTITVPRYSQLELKVSAVGYKTTDHKVSFNTSNGLLENVTDLDTTLVPTVFSCRTRTPVNEVRLDLNEESLGDVVVVAFQSISCGRFQSYCRSNVRQLCGFHTLKDRDEKNIGGVTIYPNPARSGTSIKVEWKGVAGRYHWLLADMSGRTISSGEMNVVDKIITYHLQLPSVVAGTYILSFSNDKGKPFFEKIIII